jgi:hypothetical protein
VKLARLRKPKAECSPLHVDYRPKANAAILWVTLREFYTLGGTEQGKETKNLNVIDVLSVQE